METKADYESRINAALDALHGATTRKLTPKQINADRPAVAQFVAAEIRREARKFADDAAPPHVTRKNTDAPLNALELRRAAVMMTVLMAEAMERGELGAAYIPEEEGAACAMVILTRNQSKAKRQQEMAHELSHHVLRTRVAPKFYDAETVLCEELDGRVIRHGIACDVEKIIL